MQNALVELLTAGESGQPLPISGYLSLVPAAREALSQLPTNYTSPHIDRFKSSIAQVFGDANEGFPSIPLTAFGDYFRNNEAAACNVALPSGFSAIFWQTASAAVGIIFLASLLYCSPTKKKEEMPKYEK
jgi:hypothetical protein